MYLASTPVTDAGFFDRAHELKQLAGVIDALRAGAPRWLCIVGRRKVGKTSLVLEAMRRSRHKDVHFVVLDSLEQAPLGFELFRRLALRTVDAFFSRASAISFEALAGAPDEYQAALLDAPGFAALDRALRTALLGLARASADVRLAELALGLAERLAAATHSFAVVAWDEFQELARFETPRGGGVLSLARAVWQKHKRTTYVVSGSERTMLERLVTSDASPFFQHFRLMELSPMGEADALELLAARAPRGHAVPKAVAKRAVAVLGGHPFYLQLFGEALTSKVPPYDDAAFKEALAELLFTRTGALSLYFQNVFDGLVGNAATLAATLSAVASGASRTMEVARRIGASSGSTVRYLERLDDALTRAGDGTLSISDPVFALWLQWRRPGGSVVPMSVVGDEAELAVARRLAEMGFELVYQSRASRGSFDLLAVRSGAQLGVQVKRTALPLRFSTAAWHRMASDAERLGWRTVVAQVDPPPSEQVRFLDPARVAHGRAETLGEGAIIENLLGWLERR